MFNARLLSFLIAAAFSRSVLIAQQPSPILESVWGPPTSQFFSLNDVAIAQGGDVLIVNEWMQPKVILRYDQCGELVDSWPIGFASDRRIAASSSGVVFVTDKESDSIAAYDLTGSFLYQWGSLGNGNGQLNNPAGIAVDGSGRAYVCDRDNHRVQVFSSGGDYLFAWGSFGFGPGDFMAPHSITIDGTSNVFVADKPDVLESFNQERVQKFDSDGNFITQWYGSDFGAGAFSGIRGLATDAMGNVYVPGAVNSLGRIQKFDGEGRYISQWPHWSEYPIGPLIAATISDDGSIFAIAHLSGEPRVFKYVQPFVLSCPKGDFDGDCDTDVADFIAMTINMTGPQQPAVVVDAGCLASDAASAGSYFSDSNDLHGYATQQGYDLDDWTTTWVIESKPVGSGTVAIFDPNQLESAFVITAPALAGDYVFRLTVSNPTTNNQATDTVALTLSP